MILCCEINNNRKTVIIPQTIIVPTKSIIVASLEVTPPQTLKLRVKIKIEGAHINKYWIYLVQKHVVNVV